MSQEKLQTMVMQKFWGIIEVYYGIVQVLNGRHLDICFYSNLTLIPRSRHNILLNFKLKNEASRANLNKNKRIFQWWPFWKKVYGGKLGR